MYKNWLKYWKDTLADIQRMEINYKKENHCIIKNHFLQTGKIPSDKAAELFFQEEKSYNKKKGIDSPHDKNWNYLNKINVIISVFTVIPIPDRFNGIFTPPFPCHPFWISAILNRQGKLSIPNNLFPVIPRKHLHPVSFEKQEFIFSDINTINTIATISRSEIKNWKDYWSYINMLFHKITGYKISDYQDDNLIVNKEIIVCTKAENKGASGGIINLYQHLISRNHLPSLLKCFNPLVPPEDKVPTKVSDYMKYVHLHVGQMSDEYPLSISQRQSLTTFLNAKNSSVLAVNGPPGTGEKKLMQSIVANEIVKKAIEGNNPPVLLACSSNNLTIQNINRSFSNTKSTISHLEGRWLPDLNGYATFLTSTSKPEKEIKDTNFLKPDGSGLFKRIETKEYINKAKHFFLNKMESFTGINYLSIDGCINKLRFEINELQNTLISLKDQWNALKEQEMEFVNKYTTNLIKKEYFRNGILDIVKITNDEFWFVKKEKEVIDYFDTEPLLIKLLCTVNLPFALKKRVFFISQLLSDTPINIDEKIFTRKNNCLLFFSEHINLLKRTKNKIEQWVEIKNMNNIKGNPPQSNEELRYHENNKSQSNNFAPNYFYDELDTGLRHRSFQLAVHYWEGRWLNEVEAFIKDPKKDKMGLDSSFKRWKMRSMLTPCFVSSFYMAPKFFSYFKIDTETNLWSNPPLLELIDILMIDEAGQTSPEVGVASFALAKKAIVIGDIKQIEPIWNIVPNIDIETLYSNNLVDNLSDKKYQNKYKDKGVLCANGSIMKMAQYACEYREEDIPERGLMLKEHFRCQNEIINFCNELAYSGQLIPLKGDNNTNAEFPTMGFIHVEGNSSFFHKSRINKNEVNAISEWLLKNKRNIEANGKKIEERVGIITTFNGQKQAIYNELKRIGLNVNSMKINTIYTLLNTECDIIVFSSVYGEEDADQMFFDKDNKPNMLNIIVSRARENFIVFGNERIFRAESKTPSGILKRHLTPMVTSLIIST